MSNVSFRPSGAGPRRPAPIRWACTSGPVPCRRCYAAFEEGDPAYRVACRGCAAPAGVPCRRPRGGNERVCHQRDTDAIGMGLLDPCDGLSWDGRHDKPLPLFAAPVANACRVVTGSPANADPNGVPAAAPADGRRKSLPLEKLWAA